MAFETATFNPKQFELRNYTNPYVTPEQAQDIALTESRVNGQLDFLAQMLGWNGPNYWTNLPNTPNQKRQLLGGSYGVYDGYFYPTILAIQNWDNKIIVDRTPFLRPGQQVYVEKVILGSDEYTIQSLEVEGETYVVSLGTLPQTFYDQIAAGVQLKVLIPTLRPAPFFRGTVGASGDASFVVGANGSDLVLYPAYDTEKKFPYLGRSFFADAVYYFDQPVYIKLNLSQPDIAVSPEYDAEQQLWYLTIPENLTQGVLSPTVYLCWNYSDSSLLTTVSTPVLVQYWEDSSDWGSVPTLDFFTGAWGNKGGALPFNLAFDSLSIHGVSEEAAIVTDPVLRSLGYNDLMTQVYSQLTPHDLTAPGNPQSGDLWWNPATGVLATWYDPENQGCATWVEIDYRKDPVAPIVATLVYPNVAAFAAAAPSITSGETVLILNATGLSTSNGIIGLYGTITAPASLYLYKEVGSNFWTCYRFNFANATDFKANALILPSQVPCYVDNAYGIAPSGSTLNIENLDFQITDTIPAVFLKRYTKSNWVILPDSTLRYISKSALFGYENQGEMWWDYANPVEETRAASIYIESAWVSVNYNSLSGAPSYSFDPNALRFYVDGNLLFNGIEYTNGDYSFIYSYNTTTQEYDIIYTPITLIGETQLPTFEVSDSLEGTYRLDLTEQVFGGIIYRMTPNVADAETPLRLWKSQDLQDVGTLAHLAEDNYINPLVADKNNGPGAENWERYYVRLPLDYGRNGDEWQKTALICQDFAYWGSSIEPEFMRCPPEDDTPAIYEELFLYDQPIPDYTYVYCEPYLYSNIAYLDSYEIEDYANAGFFPANDLPFDGYDEGTLISYDPLHNRLADVTSPYGEGYGDWEGVYKNINPCIPLTGFFVNDELSGALDTVAAPLWDASIYKAAPTCENEPSSYTVDSNHYKIGYAYFVADASAAEDGFFDPQQKSAWRYPVDPLTRTLYLTPRAYSGKNT